MTEYVLRCLSVTGIIVHNTPIIRSPVGRYLKGFDPEGARGIGIVAWTDDEHEALRFSSQIEAFRFWQQVTKSHPRLPNGSPNRPLTAFSFTVDPI